MFNWLSSLVRILIEDGFNISMESKLGSSLHFFIFDIIKIIILLSFMIFVISYLRSYFQPERTKKILSKFSGVGGNVMASILGTVTPFCSCSSVPLFVGFVETGIPLGVTFSFLITSPIVNEAAFVVLLASFGWKVALIYTISGVFIGVVGGIIIGKLKAEKYVESYIYDLKSSEENIPKMTQNLRIQFAKEQVNFIIKKVWIFLIIGIGIGALIHGWAPTELLTKYAGNGNPFAVWVAVIFGIPLYSNAIGTIPIAEALIGKGVGLGTALAFMMSVTVMSLPEMIILKQVIKPKLIAIFVSIVGLGIILIGYLFNYGIKL
jgi:uncharacterized protein